MKKCLICIIAMAVMLSILTGGLMCQATEKDGSKEKTNVAESVNSEVTAKGFQKMAQDGQLELYLHEDNGEILLVDTVGNLQWRSSPADVEDETLAKGIFKMSLRSVLTITVVDSTSNAATESTLACYPECVLSDDGVTYEKLNNGLRIIFRFVDYGITVPVEITLEDGALCAAVNTEKIEETATTWIRTLSILPYFGAANSNAQGYMLVPDGCGALIRFNNGKTTANLYDEEVYGADLAKTENTSKKIAQQVYLPVFGLNNENAGFLAIIDNGAANASIRGEVAGKRSSYNSVSSYFTLRDSSVVSIGDRKVTDYEDQIKNIGKISVRYYFYSNGGGYGEMAKLYQDYLIKQQGMSRKSSSSATFIQVLNSYSQKKTFLGFTYKKQVELTSYDETQFLLKRLMESGVSEVNAVLKNWDSGSAKESISQKPKIPFALGGNKSFQQLQNFGEEMQIPLYFSTRLVAYRSNSWLSNLKDAARNITNVNIQRYDYLLSNYQKDTDSDPQYLLAPSRLMKKTEKMAAFYEKRQLTNIAVDDIATMSYTDYTKGSPSEKTQTADRFTEALAYLYNRGMCMIAEGANGYALSYLNAVIAAPVFHSSFDIEDEEIPFYQLVLNGMMDYTTPAINLSSNPQKMFLKALETGSNLCYLLADNNGEVLEGNSNSRYYSLNYVDWQEQIVRQYTDYQNVWEKSGGMLIAKHELLDKNAVAITYENGCELIINYSEKEVHTAYGVVKPENYLLAEGA